MRGDRRHHEGRLGDSVRDHFTDVAISTGAECFSRLLAVLGDRIDAGHHVHPVFKRGQQG